LTNVSEKGIVKHKTNDNPLKNMCSFDVLRACRHLFISTEDVTAGENKTVSRERNPNNESGRTF